MIVYGIKNCDTVKKARRWLEQNEIAYEFHDVRQDGLSTELVERWLQSVSLDTLINRRGTTWRQLDTADKQDLDQTAAIALLIRQPTLIRRPVVETNGQCTVGFSESLFQEHYGH